MLTAVPKEYHQEEEICQEEEQSSLLHHQVAMSGEPYQDWVCKDYIWVGSRCSSTTLFKVMHARQLSFVGAAHEAHCCSAQPWLRTQ